MTRTIRFETAINAFRWILVLPSAVAGWTLGQMLFLVVVYATDNYQQYESFPYQLPFKAFVDFISGVGAITAVFFVTPEGWKTRACVAITGLFVAFGACSLTEFAEYHTGVVGVASLLTGAASATVVGVAVERALVQRTPNLAIPADRDPRERGSRPLNSNR